MDAIRVRKQTPSGQKLKAKQFDVFGARGFVFILEKAHVVKQFPVLKGSDEIDGHLTELN